MLVVNSTPIDSCFYDVNNRYFTRVPIYNAREGEEKYQYYANVAIGSFSRPCRVDRDFKVYFASRIA